MVLKVRLPRLCFLAVTMLFMSLEKTTCLGSEQIIVPFGKWRGMRLDDIRSRFPQDLVELSERRILLREAEEPFGLIRRGRRMVLHPVDVVWDAVHEVIDSSAHFQEVIFVALRISNRSFSTYLAPQTDLRQSQSAFNTTGHGELVPANVSNEFFLI